jgi:hypothetical protein
MRKIKSVVILIVCFALFGFIMNRVSAEGIPPAWHLDGGVYHMVSFPYMPEDRDPQVSLANYLGAYDKTQWRFFRYDPAQSRYIELKSPDWSDGQNFDFGRGYWIISRNTTTIDIDGEPVQGEDRILLQHEGTGWNQIGNIYDSDFLVEYLYVARESNPTNPVQLIHANNDLTYRTLKEFENGSYIDVPSIAKNTLEVGKGYWLKVREGVMENVYLIFDPAGLQSISTTNFTSQDFLTWVAQQEDPPDPPPAIESSSSVSFSGSSSGGGGCFIATAAYGKYDHPTVQILREFRDRYLLPNSFGRIFVGIYYRFSPSLVRFVANRQPIMSLVRFSLMPVIGISAIVSKMNVYGFLIILAFPFLGSFFFLKKGVWGKCKSKFSRKLKEGRRKR